MSLNCHLLTGLVLVFANARDSGRHAHRSAQLVFALEAPFRLDDGDGERECRWAAIAPQQPHRIRGAGEPIAHLFVDPGPQHWLRWQQAGGVALAPDDQLAERLRAAAHSRLEDAPAERLALDWRMHSLPGLADAPPRDARIARALAAIEADPVDGGHAHQPLAALVHLSPSRFLALFREQVGMPVRHYVLWRRLLHAVALLDRGESVTTAAHASGFADIAHLSRSFRRVLGASPSEIRLPGLDKR